MNRHAMFAVPALVLAASAGQAVGQVSIFSATRSVQAVAGDGSGSQHFSSTEPGVFNRQASVTFANGSASAHQSSDTGAWAIINGSNCASSATSQQQAGLAVSNFEVVFDAYEAIDVSLTVMNFGSADEWLGTFELRNMTTNQIVFSSEGASYQHLPAGRYRVRQYLGVVYGQRGNSMQLDILPGNDRCQYARTVTNGVYAGTTTTATPDGQATCGTSNNSNSVWFHYVAPGTGPLRITTCGSDFDTVLSVYNAAGPCPLGNTSQIVCNDDAPAGQGCGVRQSIVDLNVTQGQEVKIRVAGWNGASGDFVLNVGPTNDTICGAKGLILGGTPFDTRLAMTEGPQLLSCSNGGVDPQVHADLWYSYTAPVDGFIFAETCGSNFDTKLALYKAATCASPLTLLGCNDDACGLQSKVENIFLRAGETCYVRVGGYWGARGTGALYVAFQAACLADFNRDNQVDFFDYLDFVQALTNEDPGADINGDGQADFFDYLDFVQAFSNGC